MIEEVNRLQEVSMDPVVALATMAVQEVSQMLEQVVEVLVTVIQLSLLGAR